MLHRTRLFAAVSVFSLSFGSGCDGCGHREAPRAELREREAVTPAPARSCTAASRLSGRGSVHSARVRRRALRRFARPARNDCDDDTALQWRRHVRPERALRAWAAARGRRWQPLYHRLLRSEARARPRTRPGQRFRCVHDGLVRSGRADRPHDSSAWTTATIAPEDSCDPRSGVKHEQPNGTYTCRAGCSEGFHVASRTPSPECGSPQALRSFCAPNCGASFYTCDGGCPTGYQRRAASPGGNCGTKPSIMLFCVKG